MVSDSQARRVLQGVPFLRRCIKVWRRHRAAYQSMSDRYGDVRAPYGERAAYFGRAVDTVAARLALIDGVLARLPEKGRQVVTAHNIGGRTFADLAQEYGCTARYLQYVEARAVAQVAAALPS